MQNKSISIKERRKLDMKITKKAMAVFLAFAMIVTTIPSFVVDVHAAETTSPDVTQFATVDDLKDFNTNDNDGTKNPAKVYFGNNSQQWWIAGSQSDNLTLFAASPLATRVPFKSSTSDGTYNGKTVNANHYGASDIKKTVKGLETSHFTNSEQDLMNDTTIYTNDTKNSSTYSTIDKLYLAYGEFFGSYITVGTNSQDNLNNGLRVDNVYFGNSYFWLRAPSPYRNYNYYGLSTRVNDEALHEDVYRACALVPAFELNLSSVIFASAAPAATSDGDLTLQDTDGNGAFTLRHKSQTDIGTATISQSKGSIVVTDVTNENTYLVVQNSQGAWSKKVSSNDLVFASDIDSSLTSFENCKVWLETTSDRITYAEEAIQGSKHNVKVNVGEHLTVNSGNILQTNVSGNITEITIKVNDGYCLPDGYKDTIQGLNGLSVKDVTQTGFTISGTPTSDVNITLPAATKKVYSSTLTGDGTFGTVCEDYSSITEKEFTITNTGNVNLTNVKVEVTGEDADKFALSWDKTDTIAKGKTLKVTVKPKDSLAAKEYKAQLQVSADNMTTQTTDLKFEVKNHDYSKVVTAPTCTEKGYTTYTFKDCNHSYVGDEVAAKGHAFGEWQVVKSPTCEQGGSEKRTCKTCGFTETKDLDPTGHEWEKDYTVDKEATCLTDGSKSIHCKNCDATKDSKVIEKLGHSFANYVSDKNATCTKDGTKTAKCDRCDITDTIADTGSMLEHDYNKVVTAPTCTEKGYTTYTCKDCNHSYVGDEVAAKGHTFGEWQVVKEATATETGSKERTCENCDYKETEVIPVIADTDLNSDSDKNTNSDVNKNDKETADKDKDKVQTDDQTNAGMYLTIFGASGLAILALLRRKKVK